MEETLRQKLKLSEDLKSELTSISKNLQIKKMELAVEKENEEAIGKHHADLLDRLQELNREIHQLELKQKTVSNCFILT